MKSIFEHARLLFLSPSKSSQKTEPRGKSQSFTANFAGNRRTVQLVLLVRSGKTMMYVVIVYRSYGSRKRNIIFSILILVQNELLSSTPYAKLTSMDGQYIIKNL